MRAVDTAQQATYWPLVIEHNNRLIVQIDSDGRAHYGENVTPEDGARSLWEALGHVMRKDAAAVAELIAAARAVEAWWLSQGMQESPLGAPACIFGIRAALARVQGGAS